MSYSAVCTSNSAMTHKGFDGIADAEAYVTGLCCDRCGEAVAVGLVKFGNMTVPISSIFQTSCGSDWLILRDESMRPEMVIDEIISASIDIDFIIENLAPNNEEPPEPSGNDI